MEYLKLIGILIIVVGFALKWDVIAVVLISGLVTGLAVSYTHLRAHETGRNLVCRLLLEKKKKKKRKEGHRAEIRKKKPNQR